MSIMTPAEGRSFRGMDDTGTGRGHLKPIMAPHDAQDPVAGFVIDRRGPMRAPVTTRGQLFVTLALVGLGGCSSGTDPEATLTAAAVAASNGQAGLVGTALP